MNKQTIIVLVILLSLLAGVLAGCDSSSTGVSLRSSHYADPGDFSIELYDINSIVWAWALKAHGYICFGNTDGGLVCFEQ